MISLSFFGCASSKNGARSSRVMRMNAFCFSLNNGTVAPFCGDVIVSACTPAAQTKAAIQTIFL